MSHPDLINFREKSDKTNMYNRRYEPAKERAERINKEH